MKIALIQEFSQASKNDVILGQLKKVVEPMGHTVFNTGMQQVENPNDRPEDYTEENPRLTYLHIGIQAALLLNSGAVDFVVTGCGTGQGALMCPGRRGKPWPALRGRGGPSRPRSGRCGAGSS